MAQDPGFLAKLMQANYFHIHVAGEDVKNIKIRQKKKQYM